MKQAIQSNEMNVTVRPLNIEDESEFDRVIELAEMFHEESNFKHLPFSREKVRDLLSALSKQERGYVRIAEIDGVVEGGFVCTATPPYYTDVLVIQDMGLFINPSKRGSQIAPQLVADMLAWAKSVDAKEVWLGVIAGIDDEAAGRLYRHFGFNDGGTMFKKEL